LLPLLDGEAVDEKVKLFRLAFELKFLCKFDKGGLILNSICQYELIACFRISLNQVLAYHHVLVEAFLTREIAVLLTLIHLLLYLYPIFLLDFVEDSVPTRDLTILIDFSNFSFGTLRRSW